MKYSWWLLLLFFSLLGGIIGSTIVLPWLSLSPAASSLPFLKSFSERTTIINRTETKIVKEGEVLSDVVEKISRSTVAVESFDAVGRLMRQGTGVVVTTDGLVVTTFDVITKASSTRLTFLDSTFAASLLRVDSPRNLALLRVERGSLTPVVFSDPEELSLGERIFFLAYEMKEKSIARFIETVYVKGWNAPTLLFDQPASLSSFFEGAPVVRFSGEVAGVVDIRSGKVILIPSRDILSFLGYPST